MYEPQHHAARWLEAPEEDLLLEQLVKAGQSELSLVSF